MAGLILLIAASPSCRQQSPPEREAHSLYVDPADYEFSRNPALLERIVGDPHGYFRFINIRFSDQICGRYPEILKDSPRLNLHGDAHVEQYAISDLGRGLTDFDDSATGSGFIDLMRFSVSLRLAARQHGWDDQADAIVGRLLEGYGEALVDPDKEAPVPALVTRIRKGFQPDNSDFYTWVQEIMEPIDDQKRLQVVEAMQPYFSEMKRANPDLPADFFQIIDLGYLHLGIGSALDLKFLVRVRGNSDSPTDDSVLEVKQVRNLQGIRCVIADANDPFRILTSQARIAYEPFRFLGYVRIDDDVFWVHSWVRNYREIDLHKSLEQAEDLMEVAYDVGVQLGLGHPKQIAAPFGHELRTRQRRLLDENRTRIARASQELAEDVVASWNEFREAVEGVVDSR